jgi:CPA1 family monovalent cation:H+ antiporter
VIVSTFLVGGAAWLLFALLGLDVPLIYCLLFGALISPTDPIAVLGILKSAGAPKSAGDQDHRRVAVQRRRRRRRLPGAVRDRRRRRAGQPRRRAAAVPARGRRRARLGLVSGALAYLMLRRVDNYQVEVLITLATASGAYALAEHLHISAPITVVVAGLFIGNQGRQGAMSDRDPEHIDNFWELIDEVLNAVLFVLIGLEVMVLSHHEEYLLAGAAGDPAGAAGARRSASGCRWG